MNEAFPRPNGYCSRAEYRQLGDARREAESWTVRDEERSNGILGPKEKSYALERSAEEVAEMINCTGSHPHETDQGTYYMPCKDHPTEDE